MKLTLYREDLKEKYRDVICSQTKFEFFKKEVQISIGDVMGVQFREYDESNYNEIYLTKLDKVYPCEQTKS
jgi:hypothetical protein